MHHRISTVLNWCTGNSMKALEDRERIINIGSILWPPFENRLLFPRNYLVMMQISMISLVDCYLRPNHHSFLHSLTSYSALKVGLEFRTCSCLHFWYTPGNLHPTHLASNHRECLCGDKLTKKEPPFLCKPRKANRLTRQQEPVCPHAYLNWYF